MTTLSHPTATINPAVPGPDPDACDLSAMFAERPSPDDQPWRDFEPEPDGGPLWDDRLMDLDPSWWGLDADRDASQGDDGPTGNAVPFADWLTNEAAVYRCLETPAAQWLAEEIDRLAKEVRALGATCPAEYDARVDAMTCGGMRIGVQRNQEYHTP